MIKMSKNILNELPCAVFFTDSGFNISSFNNKAAQLFHLKQVKVLQKLSDILFYKTDRQLYPLVSCLEQYFEKHQGVFTKSLLYLDNDTEHLLFINVEKQNDLFSFVVCNISSEVDCFNFISSSSGNNSEVVNKIIGANEKIQELHRLIQLASDSNATVLISGESGTGKELVADAIHYTSERKSKPFIKVNCAALSETLLESELFGHVKGSFTGAYKDKLGKIELAHGGTIFLDEISEISLSLQVKLLRVIQEKTIEKVGDSKPVKVDMRIIAATNKNLREQISQGTFREDLFYRLNVFPVHTVPLRERKNDIPMLCEHFIKKFNVSTGKNVKGVTRNAYRLLMDYCWPGNVRELENVIEHAFVVVNNSLIDVFDFPQELRIIAYKEGICKKTDATKYYAHSENIDKVAYNVFKGKSGRIKIEREQLLNLLEKNNWNQTETAIELGISRTALWKKIKKFEIKI